MYKLICIDMDGTLLGDKSMEIPEFNIKAIKMAEQLGVKIAIATGRLYSFAAHYTSILGIETSIIASNGAYIRESNNQKVIRQVTLGKENILKILCILKKYDLQVFFKTNDTIITNGDIGIAQEYININKKLLEQDRVKFKVSKNLDSIVMESYNEIIKCICINETNINALLLARREIETISSIEVVSSHLNNFEIMNKDITKSDAVKILSKYYNIDKSEVMCIGNGENDICMLKYAGLGVAMGNALASVKEVADEITDTNINSGVGKAIEKFILN